MNWLWGKKKDGDYELEKLMIALKRVEKPVLTDMQKRSSKGRVLYAIKSGRAEFTPVFLRGLIGKIRSIGAKIMLPANIALSMKRRILEAVERSPVRASFYARYFQPAVSGILLLTITFLALFTAPFRVPVTYAATYLDEVSGNVMVWRNGETMTARPELSILEGDVIMTKDNSSVTVHFLDDSVSRLGANTNLEVKRLYADPVNPIITRVDLYLKDGRIWTKVINLIDDNSVFTVGTEKAIADVPKKAAFDMSSQQNSTRIAVFDNMVDLKTAGSGESAPATTVIAGYQAEITGGDSGQIDVKQINANDPEMKSSTVWLASNMAKDKDYNQTLINSAAADVLKDQKTEDQPLMAALTNPELENERLYFIDHYNDLIKAETMFVRGNHAQGSILLRDFRRGVKNVLDKMPALVSQDAVNAGLLKDLMREKVSMQMKDMAIFLPGDALYPVKEALEEVSVQLVDDDIGKTQMKISQAEGTLLDIQELIKQGKLDYAAILLNDYRDKTEQLILILTPDNAKELEGKLVDLISQQVQQIKVLMAIEDSLADPGQADFRAKIKSLRQDSLVKLLGTLEQLKGSVPLEVLTNLKNVFDTYLTDEEGKDIVALTFYKLLGPESGLNFIQPDGKSIPGEVGALVIVPEEATPDIGTTAPVLKSLDPASNSTDALDPVLNPADSQQAKN